MNERFQSILAYLVELCLWNSFGSNIWM